ncbi:MAG: hypothetical protein WCS70_01450 [Verrucomicrobiota bacterium]
MRTNIVTQLHAQLASYDQARAKGRAEADRHTDQAQQQRNKHRELLREIVRPACEEVKAVLADRCRVQIVEDQAADENPTEYCASLELTVLPKAGATSVAGLLAPKLAFLVSKDGRTVRVVTEHTEYLADETLRINFAKLNSHNVAGVILGFTAAIFKA